MAKRKLYVGQPGTSSAAAYTSDPGKYTSIFAATVTNPTAGAVTLDAWLVPDGGTATDANKIYDGISVGIGDTVGLQFLINQTIEPGGSIHLAAGSATSLTVHISGDIV